MGLAGRGWGWQEGDGVGRKGMGLAGRGWGWQGGDGVGRKGMGLAGDGVGRGGDRVGRKGMGLAGEGIGLTVERFRWQEEAWVPGKVVDLQGVSLVDRGGGWVGTRETWKE
ncbi:hypothetical protein Pmani_004893 [Petrolisthes manimaculis]|uniref:Uncharacterized protein n=2 Tax=Petrolisthes manimaculis TaxID=1843537 RepID=A0AAE1UL54_9EUCA|nr:hypothetical protein Pmani_015949 [Petrolisthes manimaculis]KAK4324486.1 hypothetical protein Pmani_004893 [Petrolisthes manimaculis]